VDASAQEHPPANPSREGFVRAVTGSSAASMIRWVSATGEPGPWGETVTATIAASISDL
jgi:hypothetical protein